MEMRLWQRDGERSLKRATGEAAADIELDARAGGTQIREGERTRTASRNRAHIGRKAGARVDALRSDDVDGVNADAHFGNVVDQGGSVRAGDTSSSKHALI